MEQLSNNADVIDKFKHWMTVGIDTVAVQKEEGIRMAGALCIGNLARSEQTCTTLVHSHGVLSALLNLLKNETDRLRSAAKDVTKTREESKSSIKVLHAIIGALKNLSLARNKLLT
jgi:hypothetical protein